MARAEPLTGGRCGGGKNIYAINPPNTRSSEIKTRISYLKSLLQYSKDVSLL